MDDPTPSGERGLQEALRTAVERTLAAAQQRGRAGDLLDDVARRGHEARESVARRGQEARDVSASVTTRVVEAIQELRLASAEDVRALSRQLEAIERRVAELEQHLAAKSEPEVEAEK